MPLESTTEGLVGRKGGCQKIAGGRSAAKTFGNEQNQTAPWKVARVLAQGAYSCARGPLAPLQGAASYCAATGGLRCASTPGYTLSTLRVEKVVPARLRELVRCESTMRVRSRACPMRYSSLRRCQDRRQLSHGASRRFRTVQWLPKREQAPALETLPRNASAAGHFGFLK